MRRPTASPSSMQTNRGGSGPALAGLKPLDRPGNGDDEPLFPSLKRRTAEERADEIVDALKEAILNTGRLDGSTGMAYSDWAKVAHKRILRAIREA